MATDFDLIVVGAGVAGLTAAMVAGDHGLRVAVIAPTGAGGRIIDAERIENFPGLPQGVPGHELGTRLFEQAETAGAEFMLDSVEGMAVDGDERIVRTTVQEFRSRAVIVAAGSTPRALGIPGEDKFLGKGISHCATCDGPLFKGKEVCVIGGGDSALDEALALAVNVGHVTIFHRGETLRAQARLQARVAEMRNIAVVGETHLEAIVGGDVVTAVRLRQQNSASPREQKIDGVFVAIGADPATTFLRGILALDPAGHIETDIMMRTSLPGVFAAGDVRKGSVAQLAAIAGDGATAAVTAFRYLTAAG